MAEPGSAHAGGRVYVERNSNGNGAASELEASERNPVIVWYKHDLRTDDHPGLSRALATGRPVIGFFCFDSELLSDQATMLWGPQVVRGAVVSLQRSLEDLGCHFVVRQGGTADALAELVAASGADAVYAEDEVEDRWLAALEAVRGALPGEATVLKTWRAPIWQASSYVDNFKRFQQRRGATQEPLAVPAARAQKDNSVLSVESGAIPSAEDWEAAVKAAASQPFAALLERAAGARVDSVPASFEEQKGLAARELGDLLCQGEAMQLDMLAGYLAGDGAAGGNAVWQRVQAAARTLEAIPGNNKGSFGAIFQPALALGILSRRRAHFEALAAERRRFGGIFSGVPGLASVACEAARAAAECGDYHVGLAHLLAPLPTQADGCARRFWRWNGQITDFLVAEPRGGGGSGGGADAPTVLLVHGFGACAEHWRRNINDLAGRGFRVYACSLPGFGPSEKSPQLYTTAMWAAFVRDFIVHIVRAPVVVAGNSIGGGIPSVAASEHPHLFEGVVLVNTAGSTAATWDPQDIPVKQAPNRAFVQVVSRLTYSYLQTGIAKQLKKLYPARPFNADKWLNDDIYRASCDPCALQVLQSGFYLAPPAPLPYLLNVLYQGPVLVLQGVLDPLNDARGRAATLETNITKARAVLIEAGHCPHDECPDLVNDAIAEFVGSLVKESAPATSAV